MTIATLCLSIVMKTISALPYLALPRPLQTFAQRLTIALLLDLAVSAIPQQLQLRFAPLDRLAMLQAPASSTNAPLLLKIPPALTLPNTVTSTNNVPRRPAASTLIAIAPNTAIPPLNYVPFATPPPLLATKLITHVITLREFASSKHHAQATMTAPTTKHVTELTAKLNHAQATVTADLCFATLTSANAKFVMMSPTCAPQDTLANPPPHLMLPTETAKSPNAQI